MPSACPPRRNMPLRPACLARRKWRTVRHSCPSTGTAFRSRRSRFVWRYFHAHRSQTLRWPCQILRPPTFRPHRRRRISLRCHVRRMSWRVWPSPPWIASAFPPRRNWRSRRCCRARQMRTSRWHSRSPTGPDFRCCRNSSLSAPVLARRGRT